MNKKPLGSPVKSDLKRNCLLCSRWAMCRDPNKDMDYACTRFTTTFDSSIYDVLEEENEYEVKKKKKNKKKDSVKEQRLGFNSSINITEKHIKEDTIYDLITDVLDSGNPLPPDLKINDRDIEKPANIIDWMTKEEFIGGDQQPFARQMQIALHFMAEWCPRCSDEDYIENIPVADTLDDVKSNVVFLKNGKCPKCKATKYDLVTEGDLNDPVELVSILGQRAGKSILSTMIESYNIARWVTTPNLPATFKVLQSSVFTGTYTATTFGQAKGSFWDPLNAILLDSNWYKQYHRFLTETGYKLGEELYKHSETILTYRHKNIILAPASPSQRSLRGRTRISAVADEAGWFRVGQKKQGGDFERMNGNEVYAALKRSLTTMRVAYQRRFEQGYYNLPKPTFSMISSPSARNDLIMTRFRKSQGSPEVYTCKTPTWDANPNLPRKAFNEEFRTDYVAAMRDYGCEPPMAANPWIKDEELIENSFGKDKNAILITTKRIKTKSRKLATSGHYKTVRRPIPPLGGGTILGLDAGFSNNSFAFAIAAPNSIPDADDEDEENVLVGMDVLAIGEIIPRKDYPISFTSIYKNILEPLCTEFNVAVVISDSWQNKKIQQDLEENVGVTYYEIKAGMQEFIDYKDCLYHELITHPKLDMKFKEISEMTLENYPQCFSKSPVAHLAFQMMTVQNTGTAVVKGEEGTTDDILRACIVCHAGLQNEEILEDVLSFSTTAYVPKLALGAVALGSSGSRGTGNSNIGVVSSYGSGGGSISGAGNIGVLGRKT